jgi:hypothetical protein
MTLNAPPPWLMFLIMAGLVSAVLVLIVLLGGLSRLARGASFWPRDEANTAPAARKVRSVAFKHKFSGAHAVQQRSLHPNAEKPSGQSVQTFSDRSAVQSSVPPMPDELAMSLDELQRLAHAIALYAKRPNKELAILEAWGESKGDGPGYKRASGLFDAAMSDVARAAAKTKPSAAAREVGTA